MDVEFQNQCRILLESTTEKHLGSYLKEKVMVEAVNKAVLGSFIRRLIQTPSFDSGPRFEDAATHLVGTLVATLAAQGQEVDFSKIVAWRTDFAKASCELYRTIRARAMKGQDNIAAARESMGATFAVYDLIRNQLGVAVRKGDVANGRHGPTIGSSVAKIAASIKDGRMVEAVANILA